MGAVEMRLKQQPVRLVVQRFFHQVFHPGVQFVRIPVAQCLFLLLQFVKQFLYRLVSFYQGRGLQGQFVILVLQLGFQHPAFHLLDFLFFRLPFCIQLALFFPLQVFQMVAECVFAYYGDGDDIDQPRPYRVVPGRADGDRNGDFKVRPFYYIFPDLEYVFSFRKLQERDLPAFLPGRPV